MRHGLALSGFYRRRRVAVPDTASETRCREVPATGDNIPIVLGSCSYRLARTQARGEVRLTFLESRLMLRFL